MIQSTARRGLSVIILIACGEFVSILGSLLSGFALGIWVYRQSGSTTEFTLITVCTTLPAVLISPIAGVLIDRWDRRRTLVLSEVGMGLTTLLLFLLLLGGQLQIWHIYLMVALISLSTAFLRPAYAASIALLVAKSELGRANGIMQTAQSAPQIIGPVLAGLLLTLLPIQDILLIDLVSFLAPILILLYVRIPRPKRSLAAQTSAAALGGEIAAGWRYLTARSGLLSLLVLFAATNFVGNVVGVLVTPLVLSFTSPAMLGMLLSIGGVGMLCGTLTMAIWGGPRRRVAGVIGFLLLGSFFIALVGVRPSVPLLAAAGFGFFFALPISNGCIQVIWQRKVALDLQGRVFALSGMIAMSTTPVAALLAGPLADRVFEPLLRPNGALAGSVGQLIGVGAGRGIGLMFILAGLLMIAVTLAGYLYPRLRLIDDELPDMLGESPSEAGDAVQTLPVPEQLEVM